MYKKTICYTQFLNEVGYHIKKENSSTQATYRKPSANPNFTIKNIKKSGGDIAGTLSSFKE